MTIHSPQKHSETNAASPHWELGLSGGSYLVVKDGIIASLANKALRKLAYYNKSGARWKMNSIEWDDKGNHISVLSVSEKGIAERGLIIRHLVLPNRIAGSEKILDFISSESSKNAYVNIMEQYYPSYNVGKFEELNRRITVDEYVKVLSYAKKIGLNRAADH